MLTGGLEVSFSIVSQHPPGFGKENSSFAFFYLIDWDVNWMSPVQGKSPPVQVKEPYGNFDMVTCRLSSCSPECTIILERGSGSI